MRWHTALWVAAIVLAVLALVRVALGAFGSVDLLAFAVICGAIGELVEA